MYKIKTKNITCQTLLKLIALKILTRILVKVYNGNNLPSESSDNIFDFPTLLDCIVRAIKIRW